MRARQYAVLGVLLLAACKVATAPDVPADLVCTNVVAPATFRTVDAAGDTITWANRYAVPHRMADTVVIGGSGPSVVLVSAHGGRCTSLADSLIIYSDLTLLK